MAQRTIARLYDNYDDAAAVVSRLESTGVPHSDISIVSRDHDTRVVPESTRIQADPLLAGAGIPGATTPIGSEAVPVTAYPDDDVRTMTTRSTAPEAGTAAGTGATIGTVLGGGAGLLAGIGALAIPGIGPVVAAGWLIATLTGAGVGAAAGGLVGGLTGSGVSAEEAGVYNEGVRRGGTLVTVRTDEADVVRIESIMAERKAADWRARDTEWRAAGWNGRTEEFDTLPPAEGLGATRGVLDPTLDATRTASGGAYRNGPTQVEKTPGDLRGFASGEGRYGGGRVSRS